LVDREDIVGEFLLIYIDIEVLHFMTKFYHIIDDDDSSLFQFVPYELEEYFATFFETIYEYKVIFLI
jgi:hypothetical protein